MAAGREPERGPAAEAEAEGREPPAGASGRGTGVGSGPDGRRSQARRMQTMVERVDEAPSEEYTITEHCVDYIPFAQAKAHCESFGLQLCTRKQLREGAGWDADEDTGCGVDEMLVWTSESCEKEVAGLKVAGSVTLKTSECPTKAQAEEMIAEVAGKEASQVTANVACNSKGERLRRLKRHASDDDGSYEGITYLTELFEYLESRRRSARGCAG